MRVKISTTGFAVIVLVTIASGPLLGRARRPARRRPGRWRSCRRREHLSPLVPRKS
jgi:hypothetical protein